MKTNIEDKEHRDHNLLFISLSNKTTLKNSIHNDILGMLSPRFKNIFVLCWGRKGYTKEQNIHYLSGKLYHWILYSKLPKIDFIYINDFFIGGAYGVYLKKKTKVSLFLRCGSPWKYDLNSVSAIMKAGVVAITKPLVLKNCTKVIYNSQAIVQRQYRHNWSVVYNGVDTKLFRPMPNIKSIDRNKLNLLFIGNINKEKGLDYLFEAVKDLRDKVNLTIVGDGPLLDKYRNKYYFVRYLGRVPKEIVPKIINAHDVLVHPSYVESMPNVVLEAMACGKAVVGSKVFGVPEIVVESKNGFLVPQKDRVTLKKVILFLAQHPQTYQKIGAENRKKVLNKYEKEKQLQKLYRNLGCTYT